MNLTREARKVVVSCIESSSSGSGYANGCKSRGKRAGSSDGGITECSPDEVS